MAFTVTIGRVFPFMLTVAHASATPTPDDEAIEWPS